MAVVKDIVKDLFITIGLFAQACVVFYLFEKLPFALSLLALALMSFDSWLYYRAPYSDRQAYRSKYFILGDGVRIWRSLRRRS